MYRWGMPWAQPHSTHRMAWQAAHILNLEIQRPFPPPGGVRCKWPVQRTQGGLVRSH